GMSPSMLSTSTSTSFAFTGTSSPPIGASSASAETGPTTAGAASPCSQSTCRVSLSAVEKLLRHCWHLKWRWGRIRGRRGGGVSSSKGTTGGSGAGGAHGASSSPSLGPAAAKICQNRTRELAQVWLERYVANSP